MDYLPCYVLLHLHTVFGVEPHKVSLQSKLSVS